MDLLRRGQGLATVAWSDAVVSPGITPVRAVHLTELRQGLNEAYASAGQVSPTYTDNRLEGGVTPIKEIHFAELRVAVAALEQ